MTYNKEQWENRGKSNSNQAYNSAFFLPMKVNLKHCIAFRIN